MNLGRFVCPKCGNPIQFTATDNDPGRLRVNRKDVARHHAGCFGYPTGGGERRPRATNRVRMEAVSNRARRRGREPIIVHPVHTTRSSKGLVGHARDLNMQVRAIWPGHSVARRGFKSPLGHRSKQPPNRATCTEMHSSAIPLGT